MTERLVASAPAPQSLGIAAVNPLCGRGQPGPARPSNLNTFLRFTFWGFYLRGTLLARARTGGLSMLPGG